MQQSVSEQSVHYCYNMQTATVSLKTTRMVLIKVDQHFLQLFMLVTLTLSACVTIATTGIVVLKSCMLASCLVCPTVRLSLCLYDCPSISLFVWLTDCVSDCPSLCLHVCWSVSLSVSLMGCFFVLPRKQHQMKVKFNVFPAFQRPIPVALPIPFFRVCLGVCT